MNFFPVIDSILSAKHLGQFIEDKYGLSSETSCKLFRTGINHSYIVTDKDKKFVFRVYSLNWRSPLEITEEIRILNLLTDHDIAVSNPIRDCGAKYVQALQAPEGLRYGVLFSFAEGKKVRDFSAKTSHTIGALMAQIHKITQYQTLQRIDYNSYTLTQLPYRFARTHFPASNEEMIFVKKASEFITGEFEKIDKNEVRWGAVHLDMWYDNMHIKDETEVTLFDFDFCGNGYLFYDIAYFIMQLYHTEPDKKKYQLKVDSFFSGYEKVTQVSKEERRLLVLAGLAVWIFYLGVQSQRFDNWSNIFLSENYLKRYIGMVKDWLGYHQIEIHMADSD